MFPYSGLLREVPAATSAWMTSAEATAPLGQKEWFRQCLRRLQLTSSLREHFTTLFELRMVFKYGRCVETYMSMVENTSHASQILILHNCHESERAEFATTMVGLLHIATYRIA